MLSPTTRTDTAFQVCIICLSLPALTCTVKLCVGMAADPVALQRIRRTGLGALTPVRGLEALEALLLMRSGFYHLAQAAAVSVEWSVVLKVRHLL